MKACKESQSRTYRGTGASTRALRPHRGPISSRIDGSAPAAEAWTGTGDNSPQTPARSTAFGAAVPVDRAVAG